MQMSTSVLRLAPLHNTPSRRPADPRWPAAGGAWVNVLESDVLFDGGHQLGEVAERAPP